MISARARLSRPLSGSARSRLFLESLEPRTLFSTTPVDLVSKANNQFAFDLLARLPKDDHGNKFFSPYSIATALEMTLLGAKGNTAAEMIRTLHLPQNDLARAGIAALYQMFQADPATAGYTLSTANRLWVSENFSVLAEFIRKAHELVGADPERVDFGMPEQAAGLINHWVSEQTHGKIPTIITPAMITPLTRLILTNAIYFKGDWASAFTAASTREAAFQDSAEHISSVQMMYQRNYFGYYEQQGPDGYQALSLPYKGGELDMLLILPTAPTLENFLPKFKSELYDQMTSHLANLDVQLYLPRFKLEESYDLIPVLQDLGIKDAFTPAADFLGITADDRLHISKVLHKSFVQVDEKGTEAAAVTVIITTVTTAAYHPPPPPPKVFIADHPFLFAIRDRATNTILFLGQVENPGMPVNSAAPPRISQTSPPGRIGGLGDLGLLPPGQTIAILPSTPLGAFPKVPYLPKLITDEGGVYVPVAVSPSFVFSTRIPLSSQSALATGKMSQRRAGKSVAITLVPRLQYMLPGLTATN